MILGESMNRYKKVIISLSVILVIFACKMLFKKSELKKSELSVATVDMRLPRNPYQDIIINNKIVKRGRGPSCDSRYEAIKKILAQFNRPITVLDIGAAEGYMSLRIAHDFDATCVMVEQPSGESGGFLRKLCELNTDRDNLVLLYKKITADELKLLSESEHFDVVIALNVLHHFSKDKLQTAAEAMLALGDYVIIETPPVNDTNSCGKLTLADVITFVQKHNGKVIARTSRKHTRPDLFANTYFVKGKKNILKRKGLVDFTSNGYAICSNIEERFLVKKDDVPLYRANNEQEDLYKVNWPKGISYLTFKLLNGAYPTKDMIKKSIASVKQQGGSIIPEDLVLQGNTVVSMKRDNTSLSDEILQNVFDVVDTNSYKQLASLLRNIKQKVQA